MSVDLNGALGWLVKRPIAHRGLHDDNIATYENSLPAARAAIAKGYAIECDVLLSSDGVPVVFHDTTLERLTVASGRVADRTSAELSELRLGSTEAGIPTVVDFFAAIDGQVPIVMELKGTDPGHDGDFMRCLGPMLAAYRGQLALMSFDTWLIDQAIALGSHPVGLTAEGLQPQMLEAHRAVYDRGCRFVSYNVHHLPNAFTTYVRDERHDPVITWTVRTPHDVALTKAHGDQMTFEGFLPQV